MQDLLSQIRIASDDRLYYVALFSALALPDICGALEALDGQATGPRYAAWFDKWIAPKYAGSFSGQDCYHFRCSLLHQGSTQHPKGAFSRILFVEPGSTSGVFHNNILNDALNIDVSIFCGDMIEGVKAWLPGARDLPHFAANENRFVTRYRHGLAPYIVGLPVIA